jgi:hypothetical protein
MAQRGHDLHPMKRLLSGSKRTFKKQCEAAVRQRPFSSTSGGWLTSLAPSFEY